MGASWADTHDGALLESVSVASGAMMFIVDLTPKTLWVNDTLVRMTGYSFEDYLFQQFENPFIPPEDVTRIVALLGAFLASDAPVSDIVRNRFIDRWGGTLHVRSRIAKILWKGEQALLYTTFFDDTHEDHTIELEQRYRSLVESASDSVVRLRPDLTIQYSNRCFQDAIGKKPIDLNPLVFTELVRQEERASVLQALSGPDHVLLTMPLQSDAGEVLWMEGTFVRTTVGDDAGMLQAILRDTTEKRLLDARMQQAQKRESLGQLAAGIAHDLNNILTGILGSSALAEHAIRKGEPVGDALSDIRLAAQRAGELSAAMLAYAGEGNAQRIRVDLSEMVAEMKPLLASALPKDVTLRVAPSTGVLTVDADPVQLRQVIMNLIMNAADATASLGGEVVVEAGSCDLETRPTEGQVFFGEPPPPGRVAFVRVTDRGIGMSPDLLNKIFDPFFSTKAKGRGLGLAAVLGILGRHGGCVRVSTQVGRGTEMLVLLPLASGALAAEPLAIPSRPAGLGTVLVVDDEASIRKVVRRALEPLGYEVLDAATGEEALALLAVRGEHISAVVLDQSMPGMGGAVALARIRETLPRLPVVRTSGYSTDRGASHDPHTYFLGKPYLLEELVTAVTNAIERR